MRECITIPARRGKAAFLHQGQWVRVINTHGTQVVDTWVFRRFDLLEFMSMEHTRATLTHLRPQVGEMFYSNRRRPIVKLVEDTSPGVHDTLMAACDNYRYALLGCSEYHDNCTDNLHAALFSLDLKASQTPSPLNLFMNIPWTATGQLSFDPPVTKPGDYVTLEAMQDIVIVFSACPQDLLPINGSDQRPTEAHFEIIDQKRGLEAAAHVI